MLCQSVAAWGYNEHDRKLSSKKSGREVRTWQLAAEHTPSAAQLGKSTLLDHCVVEGSGKATPKTSHSHGCIIQVNLGLQADCKIGSRPKHRSAKLASK